MEQKQKSKGSVVSAPTPQTQKPVVFNYSVESTNKGIKGVTEEEYSYTEEDARREWKSAQVRMKKFTRALVRDMAGLVLLENNDKENEQLIEQLYNAYYNCQTKKWHKRCKTRFCLSCCRRRSAELIQKYSPVIDTWKRPFFVTLTVPAVYDYELQETVTSVLSEFHRAIDLLNKKHKARGVKMRGIRMLESEFNADEQTYNFHLHLLVENAVTAKFLITEWKKRFPVSVEAQQMKPVEDGTAGKIITYGTKYFADKKINALVSEDETPVIYLSAQLNIVRAIGSHRQFFRFGFNLPKEFKQTENQDKPKWQEGFVFGTETDNLLDHDTGEQLTHYGLRSEQKQMLRNTNTDLS